MEPFGGSVHMKSVIAVLFALVLFMLSGCAPDRTFGTSYRSWFSAQAVNKEAPLEPSPAVSIPGDMASAIKERRYVSEMTEKISKESTTPKSKIQGQ